MKSINSPLKFCLTKGEIWISNHCRLFCAISKKAGKVNEKVFSEKGVYHLLLTLIGEVLECDAFLKNAERVYLYPIGVRSMTELDRFFLNMQFVRIYLSGKVIYIDAHHKNMPTHDSDPGPYYQQGKGNCFSDALKMLLQKAPTDGISLIDPLLIT